MDTNTTGGAISAIVATGIMATVVIQGLNFIKYLRAQDWNAVVTQVSAAVVGFLTVTLFAHSQFGAATVPGLDVPVSQLGWTEAAIVAIGLFGISGFLVDRTKARDNTQTAATPSLLPDAAVVPEEHWKAPE